MLTDAPTLKKEAKIEDAANSLTRNAMGCVVIVDNDSPIGIITELDLVRNAVSKRIGLKESVSKIMSSPVNTMTPDMKLDEALKIIDTKKFRKYPVVDNGILVGLVTKNDVVNEMSDNVRLHRNVQNAVMVLFVLFELFIFVFYQYLYQYLPLGV